MTNEQLIDQLETNHIEHTEMVLEQLQDNLDYLHSTLSKYEASGELIDLKCFAMEFKRLNKRHDKMLNLSQSMLGEMNTVLESVKKELMDE